MKHYFLSALLLTGLIVSCSPSTEKTETDSNPQSTAETTSAGGKTAEKDTLVGPKGSATSRFSVSGSDRIYTYANYTVKVSEKPDYGGDKISITNSAKEVWEVPFVEMSFFSGISGDYLLIDQGSSEVLRDFHIYDLKTRKETGVVTVDSDEMSIEGGKLTYYTLVEPKTIKKLPACPEGAEWKKNGLGIGYLQKRIVELSTGKVTNTEEYKCRALS